MSALHKQRIIDPQASMKTFEDDLAKMKVGPREGGASQTRGRMLDRNFKLDLSGFAKNHWYGELEDYQFIEDALDPTFWTDQVGKIMGHDKTRGPGDYIRIQKPSTGHSATLVIREIGVGYVRVGMMETYIPPKVAIPEDSPLTTRWNVGARAHEVIRRADKAVLRSGFKTAESAAAWIAEHIGKMSGAKVTEAA